MNLFYISFIILLNIANTSHAEVGPVAPSCRGVRSSYIENPGKDFSVLIHQKGNITVIEKCGKRRRASSKRRPCQVIQVATTAQLCQREKVRTRSLGVANSVLGFVGGAVVTGGASTVGVAFTANTVLRKLADKNGCFGVELMKVLNDPSQHSRLQKVLRAFYDAQQEASLSYVQAARMLRMENDEDKQDGFLSARISNLLGDPNSFSDIPPYHYNVQTGPNSGIKTDRSQQEAFCSMFTRSFIRGRAARRSPSNRSQSERSLN